jgi:hypothetical protein
MLDTNTNTLAFPHIVSGCKLAGKEFTANGFSGALIPLAKFNIIQHKFFGGNIEYLKEMTDYGFYACPDMHVKTRINGFYIPNPNMVTDKGRVALAEHYPGVHIVYEKVSATPNRDMTTEELKHKLELIEEAKEKGVSPVILQGASVVQIEDAIKTQEAGKSGQKVEISAGVVTEGPVNAKVIHNGAPQQAIRRSAR